MIAVTTTSLPGHEIERVLEAQFAHVVFGANLFSDMAAGLRDVFGGRSKSYQMQLDRLTRTAIDELKSKCSRLGANAILGLSTDFEELSAGGKGGMFMLVASGTPVLVTGLSAGSSRSSDQDIMSSDDLHRGLAVEKIRGSQEPVAIRNLIDKTNAWQELAHGIVCASHRESIIGWAELIGKCPDATALLAALEQEEELNTQLVTSCVRRIAELDGIDPSDILDRIFGTSDRRVVNRLHRLLLEARKSKSFYTPHDLQALERIQTEWPDRFPEVCYYREKRGLTGKTHEQWALNEDGPWFSDADATFTLQPDRHGLYPHLSTVLAEVGLLVRGLSPLAAE